MIAALITAVLATVPYSPVVECRADCIERNAVLCCDDGHVVLCQFIFWDESEGGREVLAWRLERPSMAPHRCASGWCLTWQDGDTLRTVRAVSYVESWTFGDPEVACREFMPCDQRRGLGVR